MHGIFSWWNSLGCVYKRNSNFSYDNNSMNKKMASSTSQVSTLSDTLTAVKMEHSKTTNKFDKACNQHLTSSKTYHSSGA